MLNIEDIHTYYGDHYVLQGVSFEIREGQVIGVLGRNGMGKTTLMRSLMGLTPPSRGRVIFQGRDLCGIRPFEIARLGVSLVPQGRQIFPALNVMENLTVGFQGRKGEWNLEMIFEYFPPLKRRAQHPGNQLSGGEQQMLAIGRSLMTNPSLLMMDEPTEGLSPIFVQTVGQVICKLREKGMAIILVEQNLKFALNNSDFIHILNQGQIVESFLPKDLEQNTAVKSQYLGI